MKIKSHPQKRGKLSEPAPECEPNARQAFSLRTSGGRFAAGLRKLEAERRRSWRQRICVRPAGRQMAHLPSRERRDREPFEASIRGCEIVRGSVPLVEKRRNHRETRFRLGRTHESDSQASPGLNRDLLSKTTVSQDRAHLPCHFLQNWNPPRARVMAEGACRTFGVLAWISGNRKRIPTRSHK